MRELQNLVAIGLLLGGAPAAYGDPGDVELGRVGGLTADDVAARAVRTSNELHARDAEVTAADAGIDQARAAYVPHVTLLGRYARLSPIDPVPLGPGLSIVSLEDTWDFEANVVVPVSDYLLRLAQLRAASVRTRDATAATRRAAALKTAADARLAYYVWVRARLQVVIAERALQQTQDHQKDVRHAFDAGTATKADILRLESQVAQAELLVLRARNGAHMAEDQLRILMHDPGAVTYEIGEDINQEMPAVPGASDLDALLREAITERPELEALDLSRAAVLEQERATRAGYWPRLDLIANLTVADPNQRYFPQKDEFNLSWSAGLQLSWVVSDIPATRAQVAGAHARMSQIDAQKKAVIDSLELEVRQAAIALDEARIAQTTTAHGLQAAEEAFRVRGELFRNGRATSTELIDAETDLTRARFDALAARIDQRTARVRLTHAVGRDAR